MKIKRLSEEEKDKITYLYGKAEQSVAVVARELRRNPTTIHYWLKKVGINRDKGIAQRLAITTKRKEKMFGELNPMWKGGRCGSGLGYVKVLVSPNDPFYCMRDNMGYVIEHRLVMAQHLGRPLTRCDIVHHLNAIRDDNRIANLAVVSRNNHPTKTLYKLLHKRIRDLEKELSQQRML